MTIEEIYLRKLINHVTSRVEALGKSQVFCHHNPPSPLVVLNVKSWRTCKILCADLMKCITWMRLPGCWAWRRSKKVIIICIRHDAASPMPYLLNKHLEVICVHLGLLFFSPCSSSTTTHEGAALAPCCSVSLVSTLLTLTWKTFTRKVSPGGVRSGSEHTGALAVKPGNFIFFSSLHSFAWDTIPWALPVTVCIKLVQTFHRWAPGFASLHCWSPQVHAPRHVCTQLHTHTCEITNGVTTASDLLLC